MKVKTIKTIIFLLIPALLFACTALKPVDKLSDQELIDKYYATDLELYMVKGPSGKGNTDFPGSSVVTLLMVMGRSRKTRLKSIN